MDAVFSELKQLRILGLHSNVQRVASLLLTIEKNVEGAISKNEEIVTTLYYADACYKLRNYRKAISLYQNALSLKKSYIKSKFSIITSEKEMNIPADSEIKHSIAECYIEIEERDEARDILQSVPSKERNATVNMTLGKLFHQAGINRSAIACYREVLHECPLALEAAEGLLELGVQEEDVNVLVSNGALSGIDWLDLWIKGHAYLHSHEINSGIDTFQELLTEPSPVVRNVDLANTLGLLYYLKGDVYSAIRSFNQGLELDPLNRKGVSILATIYLTNRNYEELEKLVPSNWERTDEKDAAMWVAIACLLYSHDKLNTAAVFVNKACAVDPQNVEALVVKGCLMFDMHKLQASILAFREAFRIAPSRFEVHKGLIDCYLAQGRNQDALAMAVNCCKVENNTARTLTLQASVLMKDRQKNAAKSLLEKALEKNSCYDPALFLLIEILEAKGNIGYAIELLEKRRRINPSARVFQMLADLLRIENKGSRAFDYYLSALRLDPNNEEAKIGLAELESRFLVPAVPDVERLPTRRRMNK